MPSVMMGDTGAWAIFLFIDLAMSAAGIVYQYSNIATELFSAHPSVAMLSSSYTATLETTKPGF